MLREELRIAEARDFVQLTSNGSEDEWDRALDTVASWAIEFTPEGKRISRATLRRCWEMYVALLSCEVRA